MTESYLWKKKLSPYFKKHRVDASRHEDKLMLGVPDVSFGYKGINGWIELKFLPKWPPTDKTILKLRKFKPEQRNFIRKRGRTGGHCFLMLMVGDRNPRDYVLWNWVSAIKIQREQLTVEEAIQESLFSEESLEGLLEPLIGG